MWNSSTAIEEQSSLSWSESGSESSIDLSLLAKSPESNVYSDVTGNFDEVDHNSDDAPGADSDSFDELDTDEDSDVSYRMWLVNEKMLLLSCCR